MVISTEPAWDKIDELFVTEYSDAVVYGDFEQEMVLHEGAVRVLANGWVAIPTGRLLSPEAVHHIDPNQGSSDSVDSSGISPK